MRYFRTLSESKNRPGRGCSPLAESVSFRFYLTWRWSTFVPRAWSGWLPPNISNYSYSTIATIYCGLPTLWITYIVIWSSNSTHSLSFWGKMQAFCNQPILISPTQIKQKTFHCMTRRNKFWENSTFQIIAPFQPNSHIIESIVFNY